MLNRLTDQFSADLLKTVQGILDEAKKCSKDCKCEKCEKEEDEKGEKEDEKEEMKEGKRGLWDNIHAKRKRIKAGSGERMRKPGSKGAPTDADFKAASESVEIEEGIQSMSDARLKFHVTKKFPHGSYTAKEISAEHERRRRVVPNYHTVKPSLSEDAEQIDELSKKTLGSYIKKSAGEVGKHALVAGLKVKSGENPTKDLNKGLARQAGIATAAKKLTKEEQDFIDSLNADTLDEARGRPKKAAAKDFTIHPKTKEKLMHNNPEHMKKIEALQRTGALAKPKTEAGQHIINQLRKASTSMQGGATVHFTHGESKHVSAAHAGKALDKYAGMKPNEKEDFQKKISHSHENLMKHI